MRDIPHHRVLEGSTTWLVNLMQGLPQPDVPESAHVTLQTLAGYWEDLRRVQREIHLRFSEPLQALERVELRRLSELAETLGYLLLEAATHGDQLPAALVEDIAQTANWFTEEAQRHDLLTSHHSETP